jgi:formamidopyrimidine-DNA glycosylase
MPELPDLTVFAENLNKAVKGKKIAKVSYQGGRGSTVTQQQLSDLLVGASIEKVQRAGKQMRFDTDRKDAVYVHLMLNGGFILLPEAEVDKLDYLVFGTSFTDGSALAVTDPKRWATVSLNPEKDPVPDALEVTEEYLTEKFRKKPKTLVKPFLLDQKLIGGIGNAYSDEILWHARISPKSEVGKLPPEAVKALTDAIPAVLNEATQYLRKHHPDIVTGEFREFLKVHQPSLKKSPTGALVLKEQIASKKTYYTDEQVLYK